MAEEKTAKTAKLASRGKITAPKTAGTCSCGGSLIWSMVYASRGRMMRVCEKCGTAHPKGA